MRIHIRIVESDPTLAIVSQAVVSAAAFAATLLFVRFGAKEEFGIYGVAYAGLLLAGGIQNAVVLTPMSVFAARMSGSERDEYLGDMLRAQMAWCLCVAFVAMTTTWCVAYQGEARSVRLALSVGLGVVGLWLREFRRSMCILQGRGVALVLGDLAMAAIAVALTAWPIVAGAELTAQIGLAAFGIAGVVTGIPGELVRRKPSIALTKVRRAFVESWWQGRWTLPGVAVTWLQSNVYTIVVAGYLGVTRVADLNSARVLISPALLAVAAWNRARLPSLSREWESQGGGRMVIGKVLRESLVVTGAIVGYGVLCVAAVGAFRELWTAGRYEGALALTAGWVVFLALTAARSTLFVGLLSARAFRTVFLSACISATATLIAIVPFLITWGPLGAIVALCLGEVVLGCAGWWAMSRIATVPKSQEPVAPPGPSI